MEEKYTEKKSDHRPNCDWACVLCTDEGLRSYLLGCVMCCSGGIWPEGRNCSCVWLFWCSVLSSASQRATVQRESELGVRGPGWFYQPLSSLWRSADLGGWAEGNGSKREWAGCEGSRVILPAPFLSLEEYSSWRLGRGQRFKERVSWVWGVQGDFTSPFPLSGGVQFLEAGQRATVQRESELGVRGPEWFYQPLSSLWRSTVLGGWPEGHR